MPMIPATTTAGRRMTDVQVRTRTMSFVRCAVRVMCTSKVPMSISRPFAIAAMARSRRSMARASMHVVGILEIGAGSPVGRSRRRRRCGAMRSAERGRSACRMATSRPSRSRSVPSACSSRRSTVTLEVLGDLEEAIQVPAENGDHELDRPQRPDLALVGDLLPLPIEAIEWLAVAGDDPTVAGHDLDQRRARRSPRRPARGASAGGRHPGPMHPAPAARSRAPLPRSRRGPARRAGSRGHRRHRR